MPDTVRPLSASDLRRLSRRRRRFLIACLKFLVWWQAYVSLPKPFKMAVDTGLLTILTLTLLPVAPLLPKSAPLFVWVGSFLMALIINFIFPAPRRQRYHWLRDDKRSS